MARQTIEGIDFEWDDEKAASNLDKHGVAFPDAALAYLDSNAIVRSEIADGELRFQLIGSVEGLVLLFVAYTEREHNGKETIRIISARKADPRERRRYYSARGKA